MLLPYIDAMNIDVKAYTASFYKNICGGVLENVKETVELAAEKCHVEVTTLVIPTLNDELKEISEIAKWLHPYQGRYLCIFQGISKLQNVEYSADTQRHSV